jgi:ABC-type phosphate transport system substrate-binding protein
MKMLIPIVSYSLFWSLCSFAQVAVIANKDVPVDTITKSELLDLYTLEIGLWDNGQGVTIFDLKPKGEVKDTFYNYLDRTTSRMKSIWMKKLLSSGDDPPQAIETENLMLEKIKNTPGAIGYISIPMVNEEVKTLVIISESNNK